MAFPAARYTLLELTAESTGDFQLEAEEVAKGAHVFESYIDSIRIPERQKAASQALNALALVMTDGKRTGAEFPWHQLQAHHGKAALSALREAGIPARVESYLCQRDSDRKLQRQPESYTSRQVRQIREVLRRVLRECSTLGYAETERVTEILRPGGNKTARGRTLTISEFRALVSVCEKEATPTSARDNLLIRLGFEAGLRLSEITAVQIEDLKWNDRAVAPCRFRMRLWWSWKNGSKRVATKTGPCCASSVAPRRSRSSGSREPTSGWRAIAGPSWPASNCSRPRICVGAWRRESSRHARRANA